MPAFPPGLRRPEGTYFVKATEGLDSLRKDLDIGYKADIAQNLRFSKEVGSVTKRAPVSYFNSVVESYHPEAIYRYYKESTGDKYLIGLFGSVLKSSKTGTSFSDLSDGWVLTGAGSQLPTWTNSSGKKFTAVTYNDLCIISTGYDNIIQTDGTVAWELGACKAATSVTAGSVTVGTHYYAVVMTVNGVDIINGAVSNTVTCADSAHAVELTNLPLGPDGCTARKLYRTAAAGATLQLLATINSTDLTYTDIIADGSLGASMSAVNSDIPKGLYLYIEQERLFVAHDPTSATDKGRGSTVYYSDQYIPNYINTLSSNMSTTQAASNYEVIAPDDNDVITGIVNHLGTTYVFKKNSIRPWDVSGTPDVWTLGNIISTVGCPAPYSIVNSPMGILYQGWDKMYWFNGQYAQVIIDDFLFEENFLDSQRANNVGFYWNNLYLLAYADRNQGDSYNNRVLVFDTVRKQSSIDKGGPLASGQMNVGCFTAFKGSDEWGTLYAGDSQLGWVYQYERSINSNNISTKSAFDLGTHTNTYAAPPEENSRLGGFVLDNMEAYTTDALAQAAWVTSTGTASTKTPPNLGTGVNGSLTLAADTTITSGNYTELTIPNTFTLTASGDLYVIGTLTINGTLDAADTLNVYATNIVIGSTGVLTHSGRMTMKANTINLDAAGTIESAIATTGSDYDNQYQGAPTSPVSVTSSISTPAGSSGSLEFDRSYKVTRLTYEGYSDATTDAYGGTYSKTVDCSVVLTCAGVSTTVASQSITAYSGSAEKIAAIGGAITKTSSHSAGYTRIYCTHGVSIGNSVSIRDTTSYNGTHTVTAISADYFVINVTYVSNQTGHYQLSAGATTYSNCTSVIGYASGSSSAVHDARIVTSIGPITVYSVPDMYYINAPGAGTLPTSGDVTDYVWPLQVYSDITTVNEGSYSLKIVASPGAATLNATVAKTLDRTFNITSNTVLIDVWSLRTGTNIQFGMNNGTPVTTFKNIAVTTAQTWETYALDFTGATKSAIKYLSIKFTNTDTGNIVYVDNIRPSSYGVTCSYLSNRFEINASSLGNMYWNEYLTALGDVNIYTRSSDSTTAFTSWTDDTGWSAALTDPSGSVITSTAYKYFQYKVVFSSTDTTGETYPYIYKADGFNIEFTYWKVGATAETSVEFIYRSGWRNFDLPFDDKIYRKLITLHEGSAGYFDARIECDENDTQKFVFGTQPDVTWPFLGPVSLVTYPYRWYTTLPDNMYGKEARLTIYKNDANDFKLRQYAFQLESIPLI